MVYVVACVCMPVRFYPLCIAHHARPMAYCVWFGAITPVVVVASCSWQTSLQLRRYHISIRHVNPSAPGQLYIIGTLQVGSRTHAS
eukprot:15449226-Alexandrium_andersonii.AAC.1